jgi:hypothetical protein
MDISFIVLLYIPVSFYFVLSFIRLPDLCRTKPLPVIFAYFKVTFITDILNHCCILIFCKFRVFCITVL